MEASIGVNLRVTAHSNQGGRKYMEDMFCVAYQPTADDRDLLYAYFGIFDGHGGREAALYAKHHLMDQIVTQKNFWSDDDELVLKAITDGFINTHYAMWRELEKWPKTPSGLPSTSGTTASVAFVRRGKIYVGHVGDSGIVLGYEDPDTKFWRAKPLTKDHKPESMEELTRINDAGGKVLVKSGVPRVVWNRPRIGHKGPVRRSTLIDEIPFLAVARSLGDLWSYNSAQNEFIVSPYPDVAVIDIDVHTHRCLILGTDGLWNMLTPQEAVNSVYFAETNNEKQPAYYHPQTSAMARSADPASKNWINPSKRLVDRALDRWSQHALRADNTSVVTVVVDPPGPPRVKRSHVVRHSFSSGHDLSSSPVGISRYFQQSPSSSSSSSGSGSFSPREYSPRNRIDQQPSTSAVMPPRHLQSEPEPSPGYLRSSLDTSVADACANSSTRSSRANHKEGGRARRACAQLLPGSAAPSPPEYHHPTVTVSAFYPIGSRGLRDSHRNVEHPSASNSNSKASKSDDVQIHEISSSSSEASKSESGESLASRSGNRKRIAKTSKKAAKKPCLDTTEVNRRITRFSCAAQENASASLRRDARFSHQQHEIYSDSDKAESDLEVPIETRRRLRESSPSAKKLDNKVTQGRIVKKGRSSLRASTPEQPSPDRNLRSSVKTAVRVTRSMGGK